MVRARVRPVPVEIRVHVGVKEDGGGSMRGRGTVGSMKIHRAVFRRDETLIRESDRKRKDGRERSRSGREHTAV